MTATFTTPKASQPVDLTLSATSRFSGVLIRAECGGATKPSSGFGMNAPDISFWLPENLTAGEQPAQPSNKARGHRPKPVGILELA